MSTLKIAQYTGPASFPIKQNLNNGETNIKMGMPQKFYGADGTMSFSQGRTIFLNTPTCSSIIRGVNNSVRVDSNTPNCSKEIANKNWSRSSIHNVRGNHSTGSIQNGKITQVTTGDQYIQRKKNNAIGRGSTNKDSQTMSFRSNDNNSRNTALAKCRGGGCVAPAKKGALENNFKSGGNCC